ncbi:MAG: hypothetical protein KDA80_14270 [Planctomycetaceae bacterium]|nr:hypothetical protein [Planctomycetaceae bacterium]
MTNVPTYITLGFLLLPLSGWTGCSTIPFRTVETIPQPNRIEFPVVTVQNRSSATSTADVPVDEAGVKAANTRAKHEPVAEEWKRPVIIQDDPSPDIQIPSTSELQLTSFECAAPKPLSSMDHLKRKAQSTATVVPPPPGDWVVPPLPEPVERATPELPVQLVEATQSSPKQPSPAPAPRSLDECLPALELWKSELEAENSLIRDRMRELEIQLADSQEDVITLRQELSDSRREVQQFQQELKDWRTSVAELEKLIANLHQQDIAILDELSDRLQGILDERGKAFAKQTDIPFEGLP